MDSDSNPDLGARLAFLPGLVENSGGPINFSLMQSDNEKISARLDLLKSKATFTIYKGYATSISAIQHLLILAAEFSYIIGQR